MGFISADLKENPVKPIKLEWRECSLPGATISCNGNACLY